jgi:thioredoxin reductase (NADPH)
MKTELIILGGGPAGLTAGIYASRARIPLLLIERGLTGGQMAATEYVDNYPGFADPILGYDLSQKMEAQAKKFGVEMIFTEISKVTAENDGFTLTADSGDTLECRALIIAAGASPVKLDVPGVTLYSGKGVSYCAICDGPFFQDTEVAVIGGGDSAVEEAIYLTRFAAKVHLVHRRDQLRACRHIQAKLLKEPKIEVHWNYAPTKIEGDKEVKSLTIRSTKDDSEMKLPVSGVFFYVGLNPNNASFKDLVTLDRQGFVITNENMACSVKGVWAAGDIRSKTLRQIATAVGDGAIAAFSAQQYLEGG